MVYITNTILRDYAVALYCMPGGFSWIAADHSVGRYLFSSCGMREVTNRISSCVKHPTVVRLRHSTDHFWYPAQQQLGTTSLDEILNITAEVSYFLQKQHSMSHSPVRLKVRPQRLQPEIEEPVHNAIGDTVHRRAYRACRWILRASRSLCIRVADRTLSESSVCYGMVNHDANNAPR